MSDILNPHAASDVGLLTIAGLDVTCSFDNCLFEVTPTDIDASSACQEGEMMQTVGMQGVLSGKFYGGSSTGYVTDYLDFTSITVSGTDVRAKLYTMDFRGTFQRADLPAYSMGLASGIVRRNFSGTLELLFDDTQTAQAVYVAAASMVAADKMATLNFTLNGKAVSLPIKLGRATIPIQKADYVKSTISFTGQAPARGTAYPTTPTALGSTPGLLDLALISPKGRYAFDFVSKTSFGVETTGFCKFGDFGFNYTTRGLTMFDYQFMTDGDFATTLRGA